MPDEPKEAWRVEGVMYWDDAHKAAGWPGIGFCPIFATYEEAMAVAYKHGHSVQPVKLNPVTREYGADVPEEAKA